MEVLSIVGKWAAQQGTSWLLRHRWKLAGLVGFLVVGAFLVGAGISASVSGGGSDQQARAACRTLGYDVASAAGGAEGGYVPVPVGAPAIPEGGLVDGFGPGEDEQIAVSQAIVAAGTAAGVGTRGMVVAIATALQESGLRELDFGDRDSLGPFQQRPSQGWGTPEQVRDADFAARAFFGGPLSPHFDAARGTASPGGLLEVPGWEQLPVTVAAQKVQRSAFPNAYAKHEPRAVRIVAALTGGAAVPALAVVDDTVPAVVGDGGADPTGAVGAAAGSADGAGAAGTADAAGAAGAGGAGTADAAGAAGAGGVGTAGAAGAVGAADPAGAGGAEIVTADDFRASGFDIDAFCAANAASGGAFSAGATIPEGTWTTPLVSSINSPFGMRLHPVSGVWRLHAGTDLQAATGTPLAAASSGVVSKVTWHATGGLMIVMDHAGGVQTWFLHLSQALVTPGEPVEGGQVVALSGGTGVGTGPHFHFETHVNGVPVDPVAFMAERGVVLGGVSS
jgi:murein DD-endopeptidase MepM/ murein hydrolase activator NlpD